MKLRDGLGEHTVIPGVHHADAVGTDEGTAILLARVEDALFALSTLSRLFAETCRDDDEGTYPFFCCEVFGVIGAILGGNNKDGHFGGWYLLGIVEGLDALDLVFLGIDNAEDTLVSTLDEVADNGAARLVDVVRAAYNYDAFGMKKLSVDHDGGCFSGRKDKGNRGRIQKIGRLFWIFRPKVGRMRNNS